MAVDDAIAKTLERVALAHRAMVYVGSSWATVDKAGLICYLEPANAGLSAAQTGAARTELAARGKLSWERGYAMPVNARVTVDAFPASRWNVLIATMWPDFGPGGAVISWHCDVVRAA